ncbi:MULTISPECIES: aldose 1-epimerase family protein [Bradyrhizobium]|uniref:aldose 1-epimerase family protein n=1 Tax=Bradyrhizobium elkanii TaxID=29448 RepID=UPI00042A226C|nr:aldose 1-epimerase family protein [Bradyrhizobium elkanii]
MSTDTHIIRSDAITATIKAAGAELCSLKSADGLELLWQAGPEWPRHAPLLFPIVGRLKNDELRHRGKTYPMTQHGFARDQRFEWVSREDASCKLVLVDNDATRAGYPFAFRLEVTYAARGADLEVTFEIANPGDETLPASLGGHPAFGWPLLPGLAKQAYTLTFPDDEPAPIRRLEGGLMRPDAQPSPVKGGTLALSEGLFDDDAVILDRLASTSVRYAADRGPSIEVAWDGFRELGIWSKPGGVPFLCIEPWHGYASPVDFDGEFTGKPGLMQIAPGASRSLSYRIRLAGSRTHKPSA